MINRHFFHGSDYVDLKSFKRAFRDMGIPLKDKDAEKLFRQFDVDNSGVVDCREFLSSVFGKVRVSAQTHTLQRELVRRYNADKLNCMVLPNRTSSMTGKGLGKPTRHPARS